MEAGRRPASARRRRRCRRSACRRRQRRRRDRLRLEDGRRRWALWPADDQRRPLDHAGREVRDFAAASRSARVLLDLVEDSGTPPYRWSADCGLIAPEVSALDRPVQLLASSEDGRLIVCSDGQGKERRAIVRDATAGQQPLERWLAERRSVLPPGWRLAAATAISSDGRRIGGWGLRDGRFDSFVLNRGDSNSSATHGCATKRGFRLFVSAQLRDTRRTSSCAEHRNPSSCATRVCSSSAP